MSMFDIHCSNHESILTALTFKRYALLPELFPYQSPEPNGKHANPDFEQVFLNICLSNSNP